MERAVPIAAGERSLTRGGEIIPAAVTERPSIHHLNRDDIQRAIWMIDDLGLYFQELMRLEMNQHARKLWRMLHRNYVEVAEQLALLLVDGRIEIVELGGGRDGASVGERIIIDSSLGGLWDPERVSEAREVGQDDWRYISQLANTLVQRLSPTHPHAHWTWVTEHMRRSSLGRALAGESDESVLQDFVRFAFLKDKYLVISLLAETSETPLLRDRWVERREQVLSEVEAFIDSASPQLEAKAPVSLTSEWIEYAASAHELGRQWSGVALRPAAPVEDRATDLVFSKSEPLPSSRVEPVEPETAPERLKQLADIEDLPDLAGSVDAMKLSDLPEPAASPGPTDPQPGGATPRGPLPGGATLAELVAESDEAAAKLLDEPPLIGLSRPVVKPGLESPVTLVAERPPPIPSQPALAASREAQPGFEEAIVAAADSKLQEAESRSQAAPGPAEEPTNAAAPADPPPLTKAIDPATAPETPMEPETAATAPGGGSATSEAQTAESEPVTASPPSAIPIMPKALPSEPAPGPDLQAWIPEQLKSWEVIWAIVSGAMAIALLLALLALRRRWRRPDPDYSVDGEAEPAELLLHPLPPEGQDRAPAEAPVQVAALQIVDALDADETRATAAPAWLAEPVPAEEAPAEQAPPLPMSRPAEPAPPPVAPPLPEPEATPEPSAWPASPASRSAERPIEFLPGAPSSWPMAFTVQADFGAPAKRKDAKPAETAADEPDVHGEEDEAAPVSPGFSDARSAILASDHLSNAEEPIEDDDEPMAEEWPYQGEAIPRSLTPPPPRRTQHDALKTAETPQDLIMALREGNLSGFESRLRDLSRLTPARINRILRAPGGEDLVIICRALRLEELLFASLFLMVRKHYHAEPEPAPGRFAKVLALYEQIDFESARRVLDKWQADATAPGVLERSGYGGGGGEAFGPPL